MAGNEKNERMNGSRCDDEETKGPRNVRWQKIEGAEELKPLRGDQKNEMERVWGGRASGIQGRK